MSEAAKTRWTLGLAAVTTVLALGTVALTMGVYQERIDRNGNEIRSVRQDQNDLRREVRGHIRRMDERTAEIYRHLIGMEPPQ